MCRIKHVHGHSKMRGISFTVRILHAVKCEDDGSDSTHCYLMIYCNSLSIGIYFVIRSFLSSSFWLFPAACSCRGFVTTIKELSNMLLVNQEAFSTVKTLMSIPPEQTALPSVAHPSCL